MKRIILLLLFAASAFAQLPKYPLSAGGTTVVEGSPGPAGPVGPAGPSGQDGAPGEPGYSPNALISGGRVTWRSGLIFDVAAASYYIANVQYSSVATIVTLDAADATNDRIDVIAVDSAGAVVVLKGTPASPPTPESVDLATQLELTWVYIAALATTPSNVVTYDVYHENTEWTTSKSGNPITVASTNNPHAGTLDVEATTAVSGNYVQFVAPAPFDPATRNTLSFWIRSKAAWASTRSLQIKWLLSNANKGSVVVLNENAFGFVSSTTSAYQQVVIPMSLFGANGLSVDRLRITVAGSGTGIGFYLDDVILQAGMPAPGAPAGLTWCGAWVSTTAYATNCVVTYSGGSWAATAANTNSAPTRVNANWALQSIPHVRTFGCVFDGGGIAIAVDSKCYSRVPTGGTITGWSIVAVGTGPTATVDVWKIASGTALPANGNTITAGAEPALATGNAIKSTTLTGWTVAVTADDIVGFNVDALANATWLQIAIYYTEN